MAEDERVQAEQLEHDEPVRQELARVTRQGSAAPKPAIRGRHRVLLLGYLLLVIALSALYYALRLEVFHVLGRYLPLAERLTRGALFVVVLLALSRLACILLIGRIEDDVSRYNLERVLHFLTGAAITLVLISIVFVNWYTAVVSLGLVSLVLGFALQTPITSFIGWVYIVAKQPYRVGDRIEIGGATGDVIDVNYLDTTLWEFGGRYISTDHPSGRVIRFPNGNVLSTAVYNYSWPLFPYIWNEIDVQVAYGADLAFVARTMQDAAEQELGQEMMERIRVYRRLLARTAVDELQVQEHPSVLFRVSENTWVEAVVRYLVDPRQAAPVKSRLTREIIERLDRAPAQTMFPKGDSR